MLGRSTRSVAVAAVFAAVAALVPTSAQASPAMAACQAKPLFGIMEWHQEVLVTGVHSAPAGAIDVDLTCGIVRQGVVVWSNTETVPGPGAAMAERATVLAGTISPCYEVVIR